MNRNKIKVAVLRGGPSSEYEVSLMTGAGVLNNLPEEKYQAIDVLIDKKGEWFIDGVQIQPEKLNLRADVAFLALHGEYGEDGTIQRILETHNMPFTGSKSLASAVGMNKVLTKKIMKQYGIPTPHSRVLRKDEKTIKEFAQDLFKTFIQPSVIKPATAGSSVGVSVVHTMHEIEEGLKKAFSVSETVLVEECIKGTEATCGVLEHFRDQSLYALPPVEILPKEHQKFFDYESKYSNDNGAKEICPGNFSRKHIEEMEHFAKELHEAVGCRHYSRTDFMVSPKRGVFCLEINTLPGLTPNSLIPKEVIVVGSNYSALLDHLISLALDSVEKIK